MNFEACNNIFSIEIHIPYIIYFSHAIFYRKVDYSNIVFQKGLSFERVVFKDEHY